MCAFKMQVENFQLSPWTHDATKPWSTARPTKSSYSALHLSLFWLGSTTAKIRSTR